MTSEGKEPKWAQGKNVRQLKQVCKAINVPESDWKHLKTREDLINACEFFKKYPSLAAETEANMQTLRGKCARDSRVPKDKIGKMDREELVACIVNRKAVEYMTAMQTQTYDEFKKDVDNMKLPDGEKKRLLTNHQEGEALVEQFFNKQKELDDDKSFATVMTISKHMRKEFAAQVKEFVDGLKDAVGDEDRVSEKKLQDSSYWSKLGNAAVDVFKAVGSLLWWLLKQGFDLIKYILTQPATAKCLAFVSLKIKRRLCREISLYIGVLKYEEATSTVERVKDAAKDALENVSESVKVALPQIAEKFMNTGFESLWDSSSAVLKAGLIGGVSLLPYGGAAASVAGLIVDGLSAAGKEAAQFAIETAIYEKNVGDTGKYLIELIDITGCIQRGTTKRGLLE